MADIEIWEKERYPKHHDIKLLTVVNGSTTCMVVHVTDTSLPEPDNWFELKFNSQWIDTKQITWLGNILLRDLSDTISQANRATRKNTLNKHKAFLNSFGGGLIGVG